MKTNLSAVPFPTAAFGDFAELGDLFFGFAKIFTFLIVNLDEIITIAEKSLIKYAGGKA